MVNYLLLHNPLKKGATVASAKEKKEIKPEWNCMDAK